jgi:hypothetical protein
MAMRAFSHFEKSKNQFQLIRQFIHDTTLFKLNPVNRKCGILVRNNKKIMNTGRTIL